MQSSRDKSRSYRLPFTSLNCMHVHMLRSGHHVRPEFGADYRIETTRKPHLDDQPLYNIVNLHRRREADAGQKPVCNGVQSA
jgi:hypothetical protein